MATISLFLFSNATAVAIRHAANLCIFRSLSVRTLENFAVQLFFAISNNLKKNNTRKKRIEKKLNQNNIKFEIKVFPNHVQNNTTTGRLLDKCCFSCFIYKVDREKVASALFESKKKLNRVGFSIVLLTLHIILLFISYCS